MTDEPKTATLYKALAAAQKDFPPIDKSQTGDAGSYTYKYADLANILAAVRPVLAKHGLSVTQPIRGEYLHTVLAHESGETIESQVRIGDPGKPQQYGSLLTYVRRYALIALLGVAAEEDTEARGVEAPVASAPTSQLARDIGPPSESEVSEGASLWNAAGLAAGAAHRLLDRSAAPGNHSQDPLDRIRDMNARQMQTMIRELQALTQPAEAA